MARHTASQLGRKWLCIPLVMGSVVILAAPTANISSPLALLAIWAPFSLLVTSFATLAGEATQQVLRARFNFVRGVADPTGNRTTSRHNQVWIWCKKASMNCGASTPHKPC